jgi:hypothetical protein
MTFGIQALLDREAARRAGDAEKYEAHDEDLCMLCGAYGADKRSLRITCLYAIHEVVPEALELTDVPGPDRWHGYYLRICKSCRGRLLDHLGAWRNECVSMREVPKNHDGAPEDTPPGRDIPVRINGRTVMMALEEYEAWAAREQQPEAPGSGEGDNE